MLRLLPMAKLKDIKTIAPYRTENLISDDISVEKYEGTRYWAVWINGKLLAVTVYKKGAMAIRNALSRK